MSGLVPECSVEGDKCIDLLALAITIKVQERSIDDSINPEVGETEIDRGS